ncbi:hypothetical protein [Fictibacillus fluitans]|uniref:Sodium:solute symporter family protein n=1 Tax=Fictibacillus fluitans TaxID=3058422 RepID=A0ABT8HWB1_9BACL|nr:hypothetical protein [Fictibacillus sp. NE201]MDN4525061.1 hypothetical protein [Fictibacillus sp. NE201]
MIEWYVPLSIAAAVIIFNLNHVAEHSTPGDYFLSRQELGLKRGTVLLWMSFFGGFSLVAPVFVIYYFGWPAGVGYGLFLLLFLYILLSWLFRQVGNDPFQSAGLLGHYQARLTKKGYAFLLPLVILANMEGLLLQLGLAQKVFTLWFPDLSKGAFLAILLGFCFVIAGLGGMLAIFRAGYSLLLVCGLSFLFIPLYSYLGDGIQAVFHSYQFFLKMREAQPVEMVFLLIVVPFALMGILMTHLFQWQVIQSIKPQYRSQVRKLSVACFSSIPISIGIYAIYMLSKHPAFTFIEFVQHIVEVPGPLIAMLIVVCWLASVVHSVFISIFSMAVLFMKSIPGQRSPRNRIRSLYLRSGILLCLVFCFHVWFMQNVQFLFMAYVLLYLIVSTPLVFIAKSRGRVSGWTTGSLLLFWMLGQILYGVTSQPYWPMALCALISFLTGGSVYLKNKKKSEYFAKRG